MGPRKRGWTFALRFGAGLAAVAALLLAGSTWKGSTSGGGDPAAFTAHFRTVSDAYRSSVDHIRQGAEAAQGRGLDRIVGVYEDLLGSTREAEASYARLNPPASFAATHTELVALLDDQVEVLRELVDAAKNASLSDVADAARRLTELQARWSNAKGRVDQLISECGGRCG